MCAVIKIINLIVSPKVTDDENLFKMNSCAQLKRIFHIFFLFFAWGKSSIFHLHLWPKSVTKWLSVLFPSNKLQFILLTFYFVSLSVRLLSNKMKKCGWKKSFVSVHCCKATERGRNNFLWQFQGMGIWEI